MKFSYSLGCQWKLSIWGNPKDCVKEQHGTYGWYQRSQLEETCQICDGGQGLLESHDMFEIDDIEKVVRQSEAKPCHINELMSKFNP